MPQPSLEDQQLYWIDTGFACAGVVVKDDIIIETAPIFKKFLRQPIKNLLSWKAVKNFQALQHTLLTP